jgi:hypothetical protein
VGDPSQAHQLLEGFNEVEDSWRWTKRQFAVVLASPPRAKEAGAKLRLVFTIPNTAAQRYGTQKVSAKVDAIELAPQSFPHEGSFEFTADVPPRAFTGDTVRAEFTLDKSFVPSPDERELGVIAQSVSLEKK